MLTITKKISKFILICSKQTTNLLIENQIILNKNATR